MDYRIDYESDEEPRVILCVRRQSQEELRGYVRGLLESRYFPSTAVKDQNLLGMVFLPVAFGALSPPKEVIEKAMGSFEPPETIQGDPEKPEHPGYGEDPPEPPEKPTLAPLSQNLKANVEWGDAEEEEWEVHRAEVKAENRARIQKWEADSMEWHDRLDDFNQRRREVDKEHEALLDAWGKELSQHQERTAERESLKEEWVAKYDRVFSRWGEEIGVLIGEVTGRNLAPRSINGYPIFWSFEVIHKEDWSRIQAAWDREEERKGEIAV